MPFVLNPFSGELDYYLASSGSSTTGVSSLAASGSPGLINDVTLSAVSGIAVLTQVGQDIDIYVPSPPPSGSAVNSLNALMGAVLIAASGVTQVGVSGQSINIYSPPSGLAVNSFAASGSTPLTGAVTISASGIAVLSESGQNITVYVPTPPASGAAVNHLNTLTGDLTIAPSGTIQVGVSGSSINIYAPPSGSAVNTFAASGHSALTGAVTLSASAGIAVLSQVGQDIDIFVPSPPASGAAVNTLNGLSGAVILAPSGTIQIGVSGQNIDIYSPPSGLAVNSFAASGHTPLTGAVVLSASAGIAVLFQVGQDIDIFVPAPPASGLAVNSLNGLTGAVTIAPSGVIQVGVSGQNIDIYAPPSGLAVNSFAASGHTALTGAVTLSASAGIAVLSQVGQDIDIFVPASGAAVNSFAASGQAALTGAVTISAGNNITLTQVGQNVAIAAAASGSAVNSLAASGSSALTGAVTLSGSNGNTASESGQNINIAAPNGFGIVKADSGTNASATASDALLTLTSANNLLSIASASATNTETFTVNQGNFNINALGGQPLAPSAGGTGTSTVFTTGSVVFADGSGDYAQDNANFFWDNANNRQGIGTASPAGSLHVLAAEGGAPSNITFPHIILETSTTAASGVGPTLLFRGQTGNPTSIYSFAAIQGMKNSAATGNYSGALAFFTQNSGGAGLLNEWMRIDQLGKVGLGTSIPTNSLSFGGQAARIVWMERETTTNTAGNSLTIQSGGATSAATSRAGGDLILSSGISTGTGTSKVQIRTFPGTAAATADNTVATVATFLGNGNVGMGTAAPGEALEVIGNIKAAHIVGNSGTPVAASGTGSGTNNTIAVAGTDIAGKITITTGASPSTSAVITTITFDTAYGSAPFATFSPSNPAAAALTGATAPYITTAAATLVMHSGTAALAASTQYIWFYQAIQ